MTTIQVSKDLADELKKRKLFAHETYEDIIWDLLENTMELTEKTKKDIAQAEKDFAEGRYFTLEEVKKKLGL